MGDRFVVWSAAFKLVGRYSERSAAARACSSAGPGAFFVGGDCEILGFHPSTTLAQQGKAEDAVRSGSLVAAPRVAPQHRVRSVRLRVAQEGFISRHPAVIKAREVLSKAVSAAREEYQTKLRELGLTVDVAERKK